jgi:predicted nucleotidyltransferase component of viral defense system
MARGQRPRHPRTGAAQTLTSLLVTTQERLREYAGETGIPVEQLELVAAKSALIRHLSSQPETRDRFIVKGGTLLYHGYLGSRVSFKDVDFARPEARRIGESGDQTAYDAGEDRARLRELEQEVIEKMTIDTPEFELQTDQGRISLEHAEMIEVTNIPFTITGLKLGAAACSGPGVAV